MFLSFIPFSTLSNWSVQVRFPQQSSYSDKYRFVKIGQFLSRNKISIDIKDNLEYKRVTIKTNNGGISQRDIQIGVKIGTKKQFLLTSGQFLLSKIDARNGAFGVVPEELDGAIITGNFWTFDVNSSLINPHYLTLITTTPFFIQFAENASSGSTNRHYLQEKLFLDQYIPLPSLDEQNKLVRNYDAQLEEAKTIEECANDAVRKIDTFINNELGLECIVTANNNLLDFIEFKVIEEWGVDKIKNYNNTKSTKYDLCSFEDQPILCEEIYRGKSPKYTKQSDDYILNQKCNRWNEIDIQYAKPVDSKWIDGLNRNHFTKEGDILVNSTGEGTIGRTSLVTSEYTNLMYDSHVLLLRVNKALLNPLFLTYLLNSYYGQEQINRLKSAQSTKQTELGIGNLKKIRFPLPPIPIQTKIVNHISELIAEINLYRTNAKSKYAFAISEFEKEIFS